jgi:hypothetical protein
MKTKILAMLAVMTVVSPLAFAGVTTRTQSVREPYEPLTLTQLHRYLHLDAASITSVKNSVEALISKPASDTKVLSLAAEEVDVMNIDGYLQAVSKHLKNTKNVHFIHMQQGQILRTRHVHVHFMHMQQGQFLRTRQIPIVQKELLYNLAVDSAWIPKLMHDKPVQISAKQQLRFSHYAQGGLQSSQRWYASMLPALTLPVQTILHRDAVSISEYMTMCTMNKRGWPATVEQELMVVQSIDFNLQNLSTQMKNPEKVVFARMGKRLKGPLKVTVLEVYNSQFFGPYWNASPAKVAALHKELLHDLTVDHAWVAQQELRKPLS